MSFDYSKLKGRITEKCKTQCRFAELLGLSKATVTAKLQSKSGFTQEEITRILEILEIEKSDISDYFFTPKVQKT